MSFQKLGTISQEVAVDYARNNGSFVIFIENVNWAPKLQKYEKMALEINNQSAVTPWAAFYDFLFKSMGGFLKLGLTKPLLGYFHLPSCGYTSVAMPLMRTLAKTYVVNEMQGSVQYVPTAIMNLTNIIDGKEFYHSYVSGSEACRCRLP
jgi:hypothetical protein